MKELKILSSQTAIRQKPEMYLSVPLDSPSIITILILEALCWSIDEAAREVAQEIHVKLHANGSFSVQDDGPGMPLEFHALTGTSIAEIIMTQLMACRDAKHSKAIREKYCHSGIVVMNALSEWCILEIHCNGQRWQQVYQYGEPTTSLRVVGQSNTTGTFIQFQPDPQRIHNKEINIEALRQRLLEVAQDVPKTRVQLTDERANTSISLLDIRVPCTTPVL